MGIFLSARDENMPVQASIRWWPWALGQPNHYYVICMPSYVCVMCVCFTSMRALPTQELTPQLKLNLLNIHVEIRNEIYRMVLTTQYAFHPDRNGFGRVKTALLCVNRKIHTEATDVLQGPNVWIVARINMSEQARFNVRSFCARCFPETSLLYQTPSLVHLRRRME